MNEMKPGGITASCFVTGALEPVPWAYRLLSLGVEDVWIDSELTDEWMDGRWVDNVWMDGGWMDGWMDGWIRGWWVDRWMDE